jgi:hypothetical protein
VWPRQIGFTWVEAVSPDLQGNYDPGVEQAPPGLQTDWLPATGVRGEGFFLSLDEALVQGWGQREAVKTWE